MLEDFGRCYAAVRSRDPRFDGWFFTAVTSTGIYCRPSCPAATPKPANVRFFPTAAAAQQAGFRSCKRCRPDATPGSPEWDVRADVVSRAMRLIADGVVDREGVSGLAGRLGYSARQLERLLLSEVGAGPLALARAQRAQAARLLVETTALPITQVAFAAGFSSIRQFNETVRAVFAATPTELRSAASGRPGAGDGGAGVTLRLPYRCPLRADNLFGHLAATAIPGVEEVRGATYRRTLRLPGGPAIAALRPRDGHVEASLHLSRWGDLGAAVARCRRLLDLDADPEAVGEWLGADPALGRLVARAPGRRVPRTVDPAELAVRAVLGQQVSTAAARTGARRLAEALGEPVSDPDGSLGRIFPAPEVLAGALTGPGQTPPGLAGPARRRDALRALVLAMADGSLDLGPGSDWEAARASLSRLPGIGPWTVELVAMRGLGDPDAFPQSDLGIRRGAGNVGLPTAPVALRRRAERWRPWRSYATQYLWATVDHPINRFPVAGTPSTRSVA